MNYDLAEYQDDLDRFERELAKAREQYAEEHPLVQLWLRRKRTCERMIKYLEERA